MRIVPFLLSCLLTIIVILALSLSWGSAPPFGIFFSPQHGFWLNAEPVDKNFSDDLNFNQLTGKVDVYFDDRMVPHIFADNEKDA
jgi:penicillin G amidase